MSEEKKQPTIEDLDNTIQVLDMELQKQEKQIDSLKKKLALAEQARDQVSKNYTRKCADVDEAVDFLWNLYDSVVNNEKIDRDDLRYLLSVLMRD